LKAEGSIYSEKGEPAVGYSLGAHVNYYLNDKLNLRSGFNYEQSKYRTKVSGLRFGSDFNGTGSSIENELSITSIGIPLDLVYNIPLRSENSKFLLGAGGLININLDSKSSATIIYGNDNEETLQETKYNIDPAAFSLLFFTGFEMNLKNNTRFSIEPHVKYTPHEFKLESLGSEASNIFEAGVTVRFGLF